MLNSRWSHIVSCTIVLMVTISSAAWAVHSDAPLPACVNCPTQELADQEPGTLGSFKVSQSALAIRYVPDGAPASSAWVSGIYNPDGMGVAKSERVLVQSTPRTFASLVLNDRGGHSDVDATFNLGIQVVAPGEMFDVEGAYRLGKVLFADWVQGARATRSSTLTIAALQSSQNCLIYQVDLRRALDEVMAARTQSNETRLLLREILSVNVRKVKVRLGAGESARMQWTQCWSAASRSAR